MRKPNDTRADLAVQDVVGSLRRSAALHDLTPEDHAEMLFRLRSEVDVQLCHLSEYLLPLEGGLGI